jgi:hypothetical protein
MKISTQRFHAWLMSQPVMMRCFVIAVLVHVVILLVLASIKIVAQVPKIVATFEGASLPPQKEEEPDPFAAYRDFDYTGPTVGGGGGTSGKGPGGIPTAAVTTPAEYKASILQSDIDADPHVGEVIGVNAAEAAGAVVRLQINPSGVSSPTTGLGKGAFGTAGVIGPGGGGFSQRVGPMRAQALQKFKGSAETERAVLAGLRWLKANQRADGSWSCAKSDRAGSALAVLALLGHGETADSEEFGACVNKGLQYLVTQVGPDGLVAGQEAQGYAQGIVALALSEAYGMTRAAAVRDPLERAIRAITISQQVKKKDPKFVGGWRYSPTSDDADTSVTGWMILALKSAKLAGVAVSEESLDLASQYLWAMYRNGGFGYNAPGRDWGPTAIGVLCQQFMGHGDDKRIKKALDYLKEHKADWEKTKSAYVLYGWYYETQAMFQGGGSYWEYWNSQIRDTMVQSQSDDGHWALPPQSEWELKSVGNDSPVYSTSLGCLILEVYYRYLPIYQQATAE